MGAIIDSSVLIAIERGQLRREELDLRVRIDEIAISAVTASELLHGIHRSHSASIRRRRQSFVESVLVEYPIIPFDLSVARVHASMWAGLAALGISVGQHDLMIAATAAAGGHSVVTRDLKGFSKIPGLRVDRL